MASRTTRLTQKQFVLEVPASLVFPVAAVPTRIANSIDLADSDLESDLTWRIKGADLENILKTAWDSLNGEGDDILGNLPLLQMIINPNVIPYKHRSGELIYK